MTSSGESQKQALLYTIYGVREEDATGRRERRRDDEGAGIPMRVSRAAVVVDWWGMDGGRKWAWEDWKTMAKERMDQARDQAMAAARARSSTA